MKMGWAAANRMPGFLIFLCWLVAVDGFFQRGGRVLPVASHDSGSEHWKALTQENFTLVHDHEFTLCIIMLSWCGEGRSLMRDLSRLVKEEVTNVTALQLRYVYIDRDRPAVKFLATGRSPTIYLFRHGVPYVYGGRLTGPHVLEAVKYGIISNSNLGFPFAHLGTSKDAKKLLTDSTDRSFLLLDFCGFGTADNEEEGEEAMHQIANGSTNFESERNNMSTRHGNAPSEVLNSELLVEDVDEAGMDTSSLQVSMGLQSWQEVYVQRGGYDANSSNETQQRKEGILLGDDGGGSVCTELERKHFKVVYDNFTIAAAKNALSPHRVKFGYVSSKAVAVEAGLVDEDDPGPWKLLAFVQEPHRPSDVFDGKGDVESFVASVSRRLVMELEGEGYHQHGSATSAFLNDTPSLILFIDRSSTISEVRVLSQAALTATQDAAWHFATTTNSGSNSSNIEEGLPVQASSGLAVKEMITNEDLEFWIPQGLEEHTQSHVLDASDLLAFLKDANLDSVQLQGKSRNLEVKVKAQGQDFKSLLQELLAEQEEDKAKFSDSDLLDVFLESQKPATPMDFFQEKQLVDASAASEVTEPQGSTIDKEDSGTLGVGIDVGDQNFPGESDVKFDGPDIVLSSDSDEGGGQNLSPTEAFGMHLVQYDDSEMLSVELSELAESLRDRIEEKWKTSGPESGGFLIRKKQPKMLVEGEDVKVSRRPGDGKDEDVASQVPQPEHTEGQGQSKSSKPRLRFFFRDGDDLLKEKLTMNVVTPAVVIVNPQTEAYFVFPLNESITLSSLITFIDRFFLGLLEETVRSEPPPGPEREGPRPPYANFDFHDQNSIPHVTADLFHHEVLGFPPNAIAFTASEATESDLMGPAWKKDVLVLFTTPWCGFCKRMELVVREVYRALKTYVGSSAGSCHDKEPYCPLSTEHKEDVPVTDSLVDSPENVEHNGASSCDSDRGHGLPVFLQMDCTLNDCDFFLEELLIPGETYPAFVLYPAERKHAPVIYRGAPNVHSLHEFIATYGLASTDTSCRFTGTQTNSAATIKSTGLIEEVYPTTITIPIRAARKVKNPVPDASPVPFHTTDDTPDSLAVVSPAKTTADLGQPTPGMLLLATSQLDGKSFIFEKSVILILQASVEAGVRGLILNKPISWNHIQGLQVDVYGALRAGPLSYGGPVSVQNHPFFVLTRRPGLRNFEEVVPGLFCREEAMSEESIMDITDSENLPMKDLWLFLGCTSWTWLQLEGELAEKTWQLQDYRDGLIQWPAEWVA